MIVEENNDEAKNIPEIPIKRGKIKILNR